MRFASAPRPLVRDGRSARSSDPTAVPTSASPEVVLRNTREILDRIGRRRVDAECLCPSGGSPHSPLGRSAQDEERVRGHETCSGGLESAPPLEDLDGDQPAYRRLRGVNSWQVAEAWMAPLTSLHPPRATGGNMYLQASHRTSGFGAGR